MKRILYLTYFFEPDLSAGSFRNTSLVKELARQAKEKASVDVFSTLPNRYNSFEAKALRFEKGENYNVYRFSTRKHQSGMRDQVFSFSGFYRKVREEIKGKQYDLVIASSSKLFTAYLGYSIAKKQKIPLYLDIRDIFYDTLEDVLQSRGIKKSVLPLIKRIERKTFSYASHINLISGGFKSYFKNYKSATYTYFPNGIDTLFIEANEKEVFQSDADRVRTIVYAGNIGEGQGLHKIVPQAAKQLGKDYKFIIIGDGGMKPALEEALGYLEVENVILCPPFKRPELINIYQQADFLFVHLNNYKAFEKVLPSKLFELASFPKPLIAGVGGFAANFIRGNIENVILFPPCDVDSFVSKMKKYEYRIYKRERFIKQYGRETVNEEMAKSMLQYL